MADFINTVVPYLVLFIFGLLFWYKLKEPLGHFWTWLKSAVSSGKEKTVQTVQNTKEIVYDI